MSDIKDLYDAISYHFKIEKFLKLEHVQKKLQGEKALIYATLQEKNKNIMSELIDKKFDSYVYSEKFNEEY